MADYANTDAPPSMASLLGGIADDARNLIRQEISLARAEIRQELHKTKMVLLSMAIGAGMVAFASILLALMLVHLLSWLTGGALPLWACYAIIGGAIAFTGSCLVVFGKHKAGDIHVVPPRTAETVKENIQWIRHQT